MDDFDDRQEEGGDSGDDCRQIVGIRYPHLPQEGPPLDLLLGGGELRRQLRGQSPVAEVSEVVN